MTPVTAPADTQLSQCRTFLKGEPKALGTVQIMIGVMTFLFGIVTSTSYFRFMMVEISRITLWGSLIVISSGSLSVAAVNHSNSCLLKASLVMNVFSALVAGITLILLIMDMIIFMNFHFNSNFNGYRDSTRHLWYGIRGVLFVFSLLEFIISICTSAFACNASCCTGTHPRYAPPMNAQQMNAQPMNAQPMNAQTMNAQPMNAQPMNAQPMNAQPMYSPPMYSPPMYNPDFYNQQVPHQSSMNTYKNF